MRHKKTSLQIGEERSSSDSKTSQFLQIRKENRLQSATVTITKMLDIEFDDDQMDDESEELAILLATQGVTDGQIKSKLKESTLILKLLFPNDSSISIEASRLPEIGKGKAGQFGVSSGRDWYMLSELGKEAARDCMLRSGLVDSTDGIDTVDLNQRNLKDTVCIRDDLVDDVASQHVSSSWQKKPVEIPPDTLDKSDQNSGSLKAELRAIIPELEEMKKRKSERKNQFLEVLEQIQKLKLEIYATSLKKADMQQKMMRLMTQCDEKGFELEIKSADNRILQEQLQTKCIENKELQDRITLLEQQFAAVNSEKSQSSSGHNVSEEYLNNLGKKIQIQS
ncbi:hypothetical protein L2E82_45342 [Cichorium intybus]|uniref:Uncharacterized protein n=1 Tax=Cichorium intybus TaxID=13427 RepID=A0ACB8ZX41_CICIN|nr:hypothetical protein L2E82_45342 [Cichorium intybus]